ncbi:MAG: hypothetical protein ACRC68_05355 [Clostridium sp.]
MKKVGISFKDNEEEQKIYEFLKKQLSPSVFIKMLLMDHMKKEAGINDNDKPLAKTQNNRNNFDF